MPKIIAEITSLSRIVFLSLFLLTGLILLNTFFKVKFVYAAGPNLTISRITVCKDPVIYTSGTGQYVRFFVQAWERNTGDLAAAPHNAVIGATSTYYRVANNYCGYFDNFGNLSRSREVSLTTWLPAGSERWVFSGWFDLIYVDDATCFSRPPSERYGFAATVDSSLAGGGSLNDGCYPYYIGDVQETNDTTSDPNDNILVYGGRSFCFSEIPVCSFLTPTPTPTPTPTFTPTPTPTFTPTPTLTPTPTPVVCTIGCTIDDECRNDPVISQVCGVYCDLFSGACTTVVSTPTPTPTSTPIITPTPTFTPTPTLTPTPTPTNTPTPTPTPTPTFTPWKKVKNVSFSDPFGGVFSNEIPRTPLAFDSDDTGEPYFAFGASHGVVTVETYNNPAKLSSLSRYITSYAASTSYPGISSVDSFIVYMKGNKSFQTVQPTATGRLNITSEDLYLIENPGVDVVPVDPPTSNYVLVVDGNVLITAQDGEFNVDALNDIPLKKIIILADTITFSSDLTKAYGIFIANNVVIPSATVGLKIKGNLVALKSFSFSRSYLPENLKPALFVVFDHAPYFELLDYISVRKVEREEF